MRSKHSVEYLKKIEEKKEITGDGKKEMVKK